MSWERHHTNVHKRTCPGEAPKTKNPMQTSLRCRSLSNCLKAKEPKRKFQSEKSQATASKRRVPKDGPQPTQPKRKFQAMLPSEKAQVEIPQPQITNNSSRATVADGSLVKMLSENPKRKIPSKRSQAKDPKPNIPTNSFKNTN